MTYTDIEYIKDLHISLYDLLNKKADENQINESLIKQNYPFEKLYEYLLSNITNVDFMNNIDILFRLFKVLNSWEYFAERFELLTYQNLNENRIILVQSDEIKKFFVGYLKEILKSKNSKIFILNFAKIKENLFDLIKTFLCDQDTGVYEITNDFLLSFYKEESLFKILHQFNINQENLELGVFNDNLILNVLEFIDKVKEKNSILIVRQLEIIFEFLEKFENSEEKLYYFFSNSQNYKNFSECFEGNYQPLSNLQIEKDFNFIISKSILLEFLFKLCDIFYELDVLTQLNYFDLAEKKLNKTYLIKILIKKLDFFNNLNNEEKAINDEITRKAMYTYSKLYGKGALETKDNVIIKNILAITIQFFKYNNFDNYFILTVFTNAFHNKKIFGFLVSEESNKQFDFFSEVINVMIENCWNHNPDVQKHNLELLSLIGNFELPSLFQDIFLKKFLSIFFKYEFSKLPDNENLTFKFFVQKLYKDFKLHDFEEYEGYFLETILAFTSCESLLKVILSEFDLILYLTNRRIRHQSIVMKKFNIIEKIVKSNLAESGKIDTMLLDQFRAYIKKGPN